MTTITMETQDRRRRLASLRAAAVGNALEWFDWTLYGTFSAYLAMNLFDPSDPTSALLATLACSPAASGAARRRLAVRPHRRPLWTQVRWS